MNTRRSFFSAIVGALAGVPFFGKLVKPAEVDLEGLSTTPMSCDLIPPSKGWTYSIKDFDGNVVREYQMPSGDHVAGVGGPEWKTVDVLNPFDELEIDGDILIRDKFHPVNQYVKIPSKYPDDIDARSWTYAFIRDFPELSEDRADDISIWFLAAIMRGYNKGICQG